MNPHEMLTEIRDRTLTRLQHRRQARGSIWNRNQPTKGVAR
jgi:hypothetical protein